MGSKYPKKHIKRQKQKVLYNKKSSPTEDIVFPGQNELSEKNLYYNDLKTKGVPVEETFSIKFKKIIIELGAVFASIAVFVAIIFWAARIEFKVEKSENDISDHKTQISNMTSKIQEININQTGFKKDIGYLKENSEKLESKVLFIQNKNVENLNNSKTKKANK